MEKIVIYLPEVEDYFNELIDVLYKKEYFGFREDAKLYVDKIIDYINHNISLYPSKDTPDEFKHYGEKYLLYKANDRTTWYIFFSQEDEFYFIQFVTNNHSDFIANFNL